MHTGNPFVKSKEDQGFVLIKEYVPDSSIQPSIRGLLTWIYITGTCPSGYPVRTVTRSPTRRFYSKPNMKAQDIKIGIVIVG